MTTFVLHGGYTSKNNPQNKLFFQQFTALVDKPKVKIMLCYWGRSHDEWQRLIKRDQAKIMAEAKKDVEFYVANNPQDLFAHIADYDVLYFSGGKNDYLEPYHRQLQKLSQELVGKVYIGSSQGAYVATANYMLSIDEEKEVQPHRGLGLLPFNLICHWQHKRQKLFKLEMLQKISDLPILTLKEFQTIIWYQ